MTQAQILKKTGLLSMIASLAGIDAATVDGKCRTLHIQVIKSGQSLKNALFNLEALGEIDERVRRDKQKVRMTAVLQSHAQLSAHKSELEKLQAGQLESDADDTSKQLFALDTTGAFEKFLELDGIYDTMARHFVVHGEVLHCACEKIEKGISKVSGENNWKKTLVSTDPIERVLEAAACILQVDLKGVAFKSVLEGLEQDGLCVLWGGCQLLVTRFSVGCMLLVSLNREDSVRLRLRLSGYWTC